MAESPNESRVHGGLDPRELARFGIAPQSVLDLSVNVNPRGPHEAVQRAVAEASISDYPDRTASRARHAVANALDCDPSRVMLGHGSVELLWALVADLRRSAGGKPLLIVGPTFGEVAAAARAHDVTCAQIDMLEADGFALDLARIEAAIRQCAPCAVYLCQPNNPTGRALGNSELQVLIAQHPHLQFVLDQAFLSLSTEHAQAKLRLEREPNVIVIRSLTKDHALAGLRAGYALASPAWIARLDAQRPPWTVSAPAQAAVIAAMEHPEHVREAREFLLAARQQLSAAVAALGFPVVPSETHYFLLKVADADRAREQLLRRHQLLVRSCNSFGLPEYLRVAAGDAVASERLLRGLGELPR
ncbi:MAG TPA: histidinol-phosphate transaminase [Polyangiales bacterium]|nr:histidinol-phosphate transaminase [Polyangiales bacterium]